MRLFRPIVKLSLFWAVPTAQKIEPHSLIQPLGSWVFSALSGCLMQGYSRKLQPISCRSGSWSLSWPHRGDFESHTTPEHRGFHTEAAVPPAGLDARSVPAPALMSHDSGARKGVKASRFRGWTCFSASIVSGSNAYTTSTYDFVVDTLLQRPVILISSIDQFCIR